MMPTPSKGLLRRYGLSLEQYSAMVKHAGGACHLCGRPWKPGKRRYIDHDHRTKAVRGWTCYTCNARLLGKGLDNILLHYQAVVYLAHNHDWRNA